MLVGVKDANYNFFGVFKYTSWFEDLERKRLKVRVKSQPLSGITKPVPYVFIGGDVFALSTYMMKPYAKSIGDIK